MAVLRFPEVLDNREFFVRDIGDWKSTICLWNSDIEVFRLLKKTYLSRIFDLYKYFIENLIISNDKIIFLSFTPNASFY